MLKLQIQPRKIGEKLDVLRNGGTTPAVFYGKKEPSTAISVNTVEFIKAYKHAGESEVVSLTGGEKTVDVLIHDVAYDAISGLPIHVDFYAFEKGKKVEVHVPLEFVGVSGAVKDLGGNVIKVLRELKIEASPENLPHTIMVDISSLVTLHDQILVSDLVLPKGVEAMENGDEVVASISGPKGEEPEEVAAPVDLSSIEVAKKGKKDEEEAPAE